MLDSSVGNSSVFLSNVAADYSDNAEDDIGSCDIVDKDSFMRNFALFFLKLQCRCNVPATTVELISSEIYNLHCQNVDLLLHNVSATLEGGRGTVIHELTDIVKNSDLITAALNSDDGLLRTHHKRKRFYRDNFRYVEPLEKKVGENKYGRLTSYHYIPVRDTLQSLLQDESVFHCLTTHSSVSHDALTDIHDGYVYKQIQQTVKQLPFIQIILYQDAFEVVNPIGSARKMHKIVGVYMALANLPVHLRTNIDHLQLVLLCREADVNYFGQDKIFHCLVRDLQDLESNGLMVNGQLYEVRLISFLGDNLGSHWLGGFSTNFSVNSYICRYCLVQRTQDSSSLCVTAAIRTPELYRDAVNSLSDTVPSVQGIVRSSVFNSIPCNIIMSVCQAFLHVWDMICLKVLCSLT